MLKVHVKNETTLLIIGGSFKYETDEAGKVLILPEVSLFGPQEQKEVAAMIDRLMTDDHFKKNVVGFTYLETIPRHDLQQGHGTGTHDQSDLWYTIKDTYDEKHGSRPAQIITVYSPALEELISLYKWLRESTSGYPCEFTPYLPIRDETFLNRVNKE